VNLDEGGGSVVRKGVPTGNGEVMAKELQESVEEVGCVAVSAKKRRRGSSIRFQLPREEWGGG
jgi:hypothetical protein